MITSSLADMRTSSKQDTDCFLNFRTGLLKSPANAAHLERSIAQFKQGKVVQRDLLNE